MTFNTQQHLTQIKGKDYLEVKWRVAWFRDENPLGRITTELLGTDEIVIFKATVATLEGVILATGHGTAPTEGKGVWAGRAVEKAETAAIGRALASAGYGTQFTDEEEGSHLADSPTQRQSNGKAPEQEAGAQPEYEVQFVTREKRLKKDGQPYTRLTTRSGAGMNLWSRKPFKLSGHVTDTDWLEEGEHTIDPPILARISKNAKGDWVIVPGSIPPFDPSWEEFIADAPDVPEGDTLI